MDPFVVSIPRSAILDTNWNVEALRSLILKEAAVELYRQFSEEVSFGYCSQIPSMTIEDFICFLSEHQICIFEDVVEEELTKDLENMQAAVCKRISEEPPGD